jgi:TRAP-type C4-dicarboxylate transport system permease small subunit
VIFYLVMAYSGYIYALRARQAVSTMPIFKMGQVYIMFPIAGILSAISVIIGLIIYLQDYKGGLNK